MSSPMRSVKRELSTTSEQFPCPSLSEPSIRAAYRVGRGEQGVLTFEPYKSIILPHWRFKTVPIARKSSETLSAAFDHYVAADDFVGADMTRKFIQMGMTRAKRYANHAGGKKYDRSAREIDLHGGTRKQLPRSDTHKDRDEKLTASNIFREVWKRCTSDSDYLRMKEEFVREQRTLVKEEKRTSKQEPLIKSEADLHPMPKAIKKEDDEG